MPILPAMPIISRGVPAYTNDDFTGVFLASNANNSVYSDYWRCAQTPIGGANSGTLIAPVYLAYDLSGVPVAQRQNVVVVWHNDPATGIYNPTLIGGGYFNCPKDYTIDINAAAGGSLPGSGWTTQTTVTSNPYHSRQHAFNMNGANWIRKNITGITGSASNNNAQINMDVHDAHNGNQDNWIFYGDSIAYRGLDFSDNTIGAILPAQIKASRSTYFPLMEDASTPGYTANDLVAVMPNTWLPLFSGHYVVLAIGTNDANGGGAPLNNFSANMQTMINAIVSAGKIPVIPHIPWASAAGVQANGPTVNAAIDALIAANPTAIAGPDLWAYFNANQSLISGDQLHPTDPAGYTAYRQRWLNWATTNIYFNTLNTSVRTAYKVRTVLNTTARTAYKVRTVLKTLVRTSFKIQLSGAGPKPYMVTDISSQMFVRPFSTINSTSTVIDLNNKAADDLVATVTVTFPDNSTTSPQVSWIGSGQYKITYTTKGAGTMSELWLFTHSSGSSIEQQRSVPCYF